VTVKEAQDTLARVLAGRYEVDRRITLEAIVEHPGAPALSNAHPARALNDVVLNKGPLGRMMQLEVVADGEAFCTYRADGLIVATPTGSTAYALSAGGPIIYPTLGVILLAPICPHTLTNRPVVLPDNFEIEVRVTVSDHDAVLSMDGQDSQKLSEADTVRIRRGKHAVALVRSTHAYFEIWRDKLRWG
jgi:NAD+ kinase